MKVTLFFLLSIILVASAGCTAVDNYVYKHTRFLEDYKVGIHGGADGSSSGGTGAGSSSGSGGGHSH